MGTAAADATAGFERDRQRHLRAFAERLPNEAGRLTWPLERLHRLRDERLRALLRTAKERSSWHAERLAAVDPDTVTGDDLSAIPTMTKTNVMEHWDEIVTDPRLTLQLADAHLERLASDGPAYLLDDYQVVTSGGSSGRRGAFVWDFEGWLFFALVRERSSFWLQQQSGVVEARRAFVAASHATHPTSILPRTFAGSPQLGVSRSIPVTLPVPEIVAGLNAFQPTDLFSYPSMMRRLADEARSGRLRISPRELNCGAEPLLADARADIEQAFGRPVINLYAAAEVGVIARSYPGSTGLHLNEDIAVYEPVDINNNPVPMGTGASKLLVTNVINRVMPLIRYELTDEVTMLAESNPDPWTGRRIADIEGRLDDVFVYDRQVEVHPHLFRSALGRRRQIIEYQVRQTPRGANIAVRASADLDVQGLVGELVEDLTTLGITQPHVAVSLVDEIERSDQTGKVRRFIPLASNGR
jgi:phenylacetate-coenzyme A ligase PaaK-like adenylate-forming protein